MCVPRWDCADTQVECIRAFTDVGLVTQARVSDLSLQDGRRYYTSVRAIDKAGNAITATSDGVVIDDTTPIAGSVHLDGYEADSSGRIFVSQLVGVGMHRGSRPLTWQ